MTDYILVALLVAVVLLCFAGAVMRDGPGQRLILTCAVPALLGFVIGQLLTRGG